MVRLKASEDGNARNKKSPLQSPRELSLSPVAAAIVPVTGGGEVTLAGSRIAAGSSLTTGPDTAVLKLSRGGENPPLPAHNGLGDTFEEQERLDAGYEYGSAGDTLRAGSLCRYCADT